MSVLASLDKLIEYGRSKGMWKRAISGTMPSTTSPLITGGGLRMVRSASFLTLPSSFGGGISRCYLTHCDMYQSSSSGNVSGLLAALEFNLGTLTVSGNSFSDGTALGSRLIEGASTQLASFLPVLHIDTALTATTPVVTTTYTDQAGNTGQSCALTLPTNAGVQGCYVMQPHLATGDTGIRDVTNMSISTGSAGVISCRGLFPLAIGYEGNSGGTTSFAEFLEPLLNPFPLFPLHTSDVLSFFSFGETGSRDFHAFVAAVADDS